MTDDLELLRRYAQGNSEEAFAELVGRHVNLVYSAALRQVRSRELAEEVAQSVFTDLARNARRLKADTLLTAWLYQVARRTAIDVVRREARRQLRDQIASENNAMNATATDWMDIEPLLDEAMDALEETDRAAILLRYSRTNPSASSATASASATMPRKSGSAGLWTGLREFFSKHGVAVGASGLAARHLRQCCPSRARWSGRHYFDRRRLAGTAVQASTALAATKTVAMTTIAKDPHCRGPRRRRRHGNLSSAPELQPARSGANASATASAVGRSAPTITA